LIEEGVIGLQLHENKAPQEIHFKDLEITTSPKDTAAWDVKVGEKLKAAEKKGDKPQDLIVGKWTPVNEEKVKVVLEFTKDGKISVKAGGMAVNEGTYKFATDDKLEVEFTGEAKKETLTVKVTKDELTTTDSTNKKETFKRMK
jgi:uncharacterized protein (TIGR03066 family)